MRMANPKAYPHLLLTVGKSRTVLITLRRDAVSSRRSVMSTLDPSILACPLVVLLIFLGMAGVARASDATAEINLASDTAWTASPDGREFRPIVVPGGGWNSDKQPSPRMRPLTRHEEPNEAKLQLDRRGGAPIKPALTLYNQQQPDRPVIVLDNVMYRRDVNIPAAWAGRVIQLEFGAVNFGAEIFFDGKKVGEHAGPLMPFVVDLTAVATAGRTHRLEVKAYHSRHYNVDGLCMVPMQFDYEYWRAMHDPGWTSKTAYGIAKYVRLVSRPPQYVRDVSVRTSVKRDTLSFDVTVANAGDRPVELQLQAALSSWNTLPWKYPPIPPRSVTVPAHGETKVVVDGIRWGLGPKSFWWPNVPFREDYRAQLHVLHLGLNEDGKTVAEKNQRFGFVEHAEGPYYYTVNGVRVNGFSDATAEPQLSEFDAYAQLPAYQTAPACRETWKRFMRLGINSNRVHQSTPTDLMLDTADETGFMLIPETAIRGCHHQGWNLENFSRAEREMIAHARNHPSVARYSLMNEMPYDKTAWSTLIDAAADADPTRPLTIEDSCVGRDFPLAKNRFQGTRGHAFAMAHYVGYPKPCRSIFGLGEVDWGCGLMPVYAVHVRDYRLNDVAYFAPWSWLNYWPNLLEGGCFARHGFKQSADRDRQDGTDGWNSPIIAFVQRSQHPYLVQDIDLLKENFAAPKQRGQGKIEWPYQLPTILAGSRVERRIEVFNGGLFGNKLTLAWKAHWDQPDGPEAVKGGEIPCAIEPGFHATETIAFTAAKIEQPSRKLYLVMESVMDGRILFHSEETCLNVIAGKAEPAAKVAGFLPLLAGRAKR